MKKLMIVLFVALLGSTANAADTVQVSKRVMQAFVSGFPNAEDVSWYQQPGLFLVSFTQKGIHAKASYRKDGALLNFSRYYQEDNLPAYILLQVKEQYPGRKIFGVTELSTPGDSGDGNPSVEYYIKLGDDREWLTIKVGNDGEITTTERLKKTS